MPDVIIFVCHVSEFVEFATAELRRHNPHVEIVTITQGAELARLTADRLSVARLIGFTTHVIIPKSILDALGFGAYNFHPGPPEYPGVEPMRFAIYEEAMSYGVTAHVMQEKIDSGAIIGVRRFGMRRDVGYEELQARMAGAILELFQTLARSLCLDALGPPRIGATWSDRRYTRKQALALCELEVGIDEAELRRRIRAFGSGDFPLRPVVKIHGETFVHFAHDVLYPKGD